MNNASTILAPLDDQRVIAQRTTEVEARLLAEAYGQMRLTLLLTLICIVLFTNLMWAMAPAALSAVWTGSLLLVLAVRALLYRSFMRANPGGTVESGLGKWQRWFFIGAVASGVAWTIGPVLIIPMVQGGAELAILVGGLLCVCAVAMSSLVAQQFAAQTFVVTTLLPPAVILFSTGTKVQQMVAVVLVSGIVCVVVVCRKTNAAMRAQLERKFDLNRAVDAARAAHARFFDLYDLAPVGYCTVNLAGEIIEANLTVASQLDMAREALTGRMFASFIIDADRHLYDSLLASLAETGKPQACELRMVTRGGTEFWAHLATTSAHDASGTAAARIVLSDATEQQRRAAAALQESEARYRALVEWSPEPTVVHRNGLLLYVNPAFANMVGAPTAPSLIGRSLLDFVHVDSKRVVEERMQALRSGAPGTPLIEMRGIKTDGTIFIVETQGISIKFNGEPASQVVVHDITARKQAEAVRESLEGQLRESQKMQAIGTLAGGVAHDFNNILATILGNTELAYQDVGGNKRALESLGEIRKAATRARDLVQQILSFSRRQPTERKPLALVDVVEESTRLLRATLPARINLTTHCEADLPAVLADATQIQQVVINLATNAMQAMPAGPGNIDIRLDGVMLDQTLAESRPALRALYAAHPGRTLRLSIVDNGRGMDNATLERIFEPFFTTKPVNEGTGLGLAVVHGIVEAHDGAIVVDSQPGRGSTFSLYLPPASKDAGNTNTTVINVTPANDVDAAGNADACIVYIDDDEAMVFLIERLLARRGYRVNSAILCLL